MASKERIDKMVRTDIPLDEQMALLMRGVSFGDAPGEGGGGIAAAMEAELRARLVESHATGRPLRVYLGVDPTSTDIHLGHTVPLRKLRQFQDLGHDVVFLIGSFTALIGDPSDKDRARPRLTMEQVREHARTYVDQVARILDPERTTIEYNDRWLAPLSFADVIELASHFTVQQFLTRDNFSSRFANGDPIWLHEFFYALMQAYDAAMLRTDVQVGGTEQLFNLMAGRKLMEAMGMRPQVCLTLPILVGTDGHLRMSKSVGNAIGIAEPPEEQYGKVMSMPDEAMRNVAELVTRWTPAEIDQLLGQVASGVVHPRDAKMRLAFEVVDILHGAEAAERAQMHFQTVFQQRSLPDDIPPFHLAGPTAVVDALVDAGMARSKSQARRLVAQGGVRLDGETIDDPEAVIEPRGQVLQVGRRRYARLVRAG